MLDFRAVVPPSRRGVYFFAQHTVTPVVIETTRRFLRYDYDCFGLQKRAFTIEKRLINIYIQYSVRVYLVFYVELSISIIYLVSYVKGL